MVSRLVGVALYNYNNNNNNNIVIRTDSRNTVLCKPEMDVTIRK